MREPRNTLFTRSSAGLVTAGVCFAALGCGPQDGPKYRLEGSLGVLLDLRYDFAQVEMSIEQVAVVFARNREEGQDTAMKVTANLLGAAVEADSPLDLAEITPSGAQRGVISRNVFEDPRKTFPKLQRGRLVFRRSPISGETVPGEVSFTFENGTDLASGRTVFGKFEASVP
ncbi:MAG: hypothetical protein HYZ28_07130 [Myxococcales bacterium]|nr:hypothetical protein [Myxococcales bacterium]